jgi:hypothetical protein
MNRLRVAIGSLTLLLLPALAAGGQLTPQQQRRLAQVADLTPGEIQRLFDAYAIVQAQDMLKLNDRQYAQFVLRLKSLHQTRRQAQQARQQILQDLGRDTNEQAGSSSEVRIRERLKALDEQDQRAADEVRRAYAAIDEILDIRQRGRFRVFEDLMERRKFELLMRARTRAGRAGRAGEAGRVGR